VVPDVAVIFGFVSAGLMMTALVLNVVVESQRRGLVGVHVGLWRRQ